MAASSYDAIPDFGLLYDSVPLYAARQDAGFYVEEAKAARGPVLEVGCGTGRILLPIARAGGDSTIARFGADAVAERARSGLWQRYLDRVDPDRLLPEPERVERAEHLRRADIGRRNSSRHGEVRDSGLPERAGVRRVP